MVMLRIVEGKATKWAGGSWGNENPRGRIWAGAGVSWKKTKSWEGENNWTFGGPQSGVKKGKIIASEKIEKVKEYEGKSGRKIWRQAEKNRGGTVERDHVWGGGEERLKCGLVKGAGKKHGVGITQKKSVTKGGAERSRTIKRGLTWKKELGGKERNVAGKRGQKG